MSVVDDKGHVALRLVADGCDRCAATGVCFKVERALDAITLCAPCLRCLASAAEAVLSNSNREAARPFKSGAELYPERGPSYERGADASGPCYCGIGEAHSIASHQLGLHLGSALPYWRSAFAAARDQGCSVAAAQGIADVVVKRIHGRTR